MQVGWRAPAQDPAELLNVWHHTMLKLWGRKGNLHSGRRKVWISGPQLQEEMGQAHRGRLGTKPAAPRSISHKKPWGSLCCC